MTAARLGKRGRRRGWLCTLVGCLLVTAGWANAQDAVLRGGLYANGYQTVPILVYDQLADAVSGRKGLRADRFKDQMAYLNDNGYRVVGLKDAASFMEYHGSLPPAAVVLTFDGAWAGLMQTVVPVLEKYQFEATFFVPVAHVGKAHHLSWAQLRELVNRGYDVQSQGMDTPDLTDYKSFGAPAKYFSHLLSQIKQAHQSIQDEVGIICQFFAYPSGRSNRLMVTILQKLNYRAGLSLENGANPFYQPRFQLRRNRVEPNDRLEDFVTKLMVFHEQPLE